MTVISIHALVKRATETIPKTAKGRFYFNPRPREEGDKSVAFSRDIELDISIHALVKRATKTLLCLVLQ